VLPGVHLYAACWTVAAALWAAASGGALARRRGARGGDRPGLGAIAAVLACALAATLLGARLHSLIGDSASADDGRGVARLFGAGFRIGGGLVAAAATLALLAPRLLGRPWHAADVLDAVSPPAGLAIAIGRLGCLAEGCCFGRPTALPWAISYPAGSQPFWNHVALGLVAQADARSAAVHPLPLYLGGAAVIAALLGWQATRNGAPRGSATLVFALASSLLRLAVEPLRETRFLAPVPGQRLLDMATAGVALAGLVLLLAQARSARRRSPSS